MSIEIHVCLFMRLWKFVLFHLGARFCPRILIKKLLDVSQCIIVTTHTKMSALKTNYVFMGNLMLIFFFN